MDPVGIAFVTVVQLVSRSHESPWLPWFRNIQTELIDAWFRVGHNKIHWYAAADLQPNRICYFLKNWKWLAKLKRAGPSVSVRGVYVWGREGANGNVMCDVSVWTDFIIIIYSLQVLGARRCHTAFILIPATRWWCLCAAHAIITISIVVCWICCIRMGKLHFIQNVSFPVSMDRFVGNIPHVSPTLQVNCFYFCRFSFVFFPLFSVNLCEKRFLHNY